MPFLTEDKTDVQHNFKCYIFALALARAKSIICPWWSHCYEIHYVWAFKTLIIPRGHLFSLWNPYIGTCYLIPFLYFEIEPRCILIIFGTCNKLVLYGKHVGNKKPRTSLTKSFNHELGSVGTKWFRIYFAPIELGTYRFKHLHMRLWTNSSQKIKRKRWGKMSG